MAAMRLRDLPGQGEPETCSATLGRIEGQQRLRHHRIAHPRAPVAHLDALAPAQLRHGNLDFGRGASGFFRVLEQVDQCLLDLRTVELPRFLRQRLDDAEAALLSKVLEQRPPVDGRRKRRRQLCDRGIS